jgi:polysaccharide deacetylase family protein (PEP-CTERM system associated)
VPRGGLHHFSVDVEEYFHPTAVAARFPMGSWDALERRSPAVIGRLLELLARHDVTATFFVVGWLAEREPAMVTEIAAAGHELASHGYEHALVGALGPDGFRESVRRSKAVLEDIGARRVIGYRAPSFSIVPGLEWAFDVLVEEGYTYDASLFPVRHHPTYGYPLAGPDPLWLRCEAGWIMEFPATTARILGATLPAGGGAYFRLLPPAIVRAGLGQAARRAAPGMFYIHPWELDDWAPAVAIPWLQRVRTFAGRARTWGRLERLFRDFRFTAIRNTLEADRPASLTADDPGPAPEPSPGQHRQDLRRGGGDESGG